MPAQPAESPGGLYASGRIAAMQDGGGDSGGGTACLMADEDGGCTLLGYGMSVRDAEDRLDALMERVPGGERDAHTCMFLIIPRSLLPAGATPFGQADDDDTTDDTFQLDDVFPPSGSVYADEAIERIFRIVKDDREPGCRPGRLYGHAWVSNVETQRPVCGKCGLVRHHRGTRPYTKYTRGPVMYYVYDVKEGGDNDGDDGPDAGGENAEGGGSQ